MEILAALSLVGVGVLGTMLISVWADLSSTRRRLKAALQERDAAVEELARIHAEAEAKTLDLPSLAARLKNRLENKT